MSDPTTSPDITPFLAELSKLLTANPAHLQAVAAAVTPLVSDALKGQTTQQAHGETIDQEPALVLKDLDDGTVLLARSDKPNAPNAQKVRLGDIKTYVGVDKRAIEQEVFDAIGKLKAGG